MLKFNFSYMNLYFLFQDTMVKVDHFKFIWENKLYNSSKTTYEEKKLLEKKYHKF